MRLVRQAIGYLITILMLPACLWLTVLYVIAEVTGAEEPDWI